MGLTNMNTDNFLELKKDKITVIVPCRAGSERVTNKNTRPFAGFGNGLIELKLKQLASVDEIDEILISSNDQIVLDFSRNFGIEKDNRIEVIERPNELGASSTPMSEFIRYMSTLRESGVMLMLHVTHPFFGPNEIKGVIRSYREAKDKGYDSLTTVTRLQKFIWNSKGPYNYDSTKEKWPRSQDLEPLFEINHAAYMIPFEVMRAVDDRVGQKVFLCELPEIATMDIDWEDEFHIIEEIFLARQQKGTSFT
jgi:CMP-N-acetylneuraminic acid synthetase